MNPKESTIKKYVFVLSQFSSDFGGRDITSLAADEAIHRKHIFQDSCLWKKENLSMLGSGK